MKWLENLKLKAKKVDAVFGGPPVDPKALNTYQYAAEPNTIKPSELEKLVAKDPQLVGLIIAAGFAEGLQNAVDPDDLAAKILKYREEYNIDPSVPIVPNFTKKKS